MRANYLSIALAILGSFATLAVTPRIVKAQSSTSSSPSSWSRSPLSVAASLPSERFVAFLPQLFSWGSSRTIGRSLTAEQLASSFARNSTGLSTRVAALAAAASSCAALSGSPRARHLAIIDFSKASTEPRFWLFDAASERLLEHTLVAHGRNSGELYASEFSNIPGSLQSSLGLFFSDEPYVGRHGASLRLQGLEPGFNDQAYNRAIVIHGAPYVSESYIAKKDQLGRSLGCPALPVTSAPRTIRTLEKGAYLFAYYPDQRYLSSSKLINCGASLRRGLG